MMSNSFSVAVAVATLLLSVANANMASINLGGCQNFAVQARSAITFAGTVTTINTGSIGVSPGYSIGGNNILGDGSVESQSTASILCAADSLIAYSDAVSRQPTVNLELNPRISLKTADLAGLTLGPGVYSSSGSIIISASTVTLEGEGVYIFQAASDIVTAYDTSFILKDGAKASDIYWVAGTGVTLGTVSTFEGTVLAGTAITFATGSKLNGRAIAQTAVTFAGNSAVTLPAASTHTNAIKSNLRSAKKVTTDHSEPINVLRCEEFAILAGTAVTFNGEKTVVETGSVGVSPGNSIVGKYLIQDGEREVKSTNSNNCQGDRMIAYNKAKGRTCDAANLITDLSNMTLFPGVYCASGSIMRFTAGTLTLDANGEVNPQWIFQSATELKTAPYTSFIMKGSGAESKNVFWVVGSSATLAYSSSFMGTILAHASISVDTTTVVEGRLLAKAGVSFAGTDKVKLPNPL